MMGKSHHLPLWFPGVYTPCLFLVVFCQSFLTGSVMEETFVPFRGIKNDLRGRLRCYKEDWVGGFNSGYRLVAFLPLYLVTCPDHFKFCMSCTTGLHWYVFCYACLYIGFWIDFDAESLLLRHTYSLLPPFLWYLLGSNWTGILVRSITALPFCGMWTKLII